jgi:hypothetical protein
MILERVSERVIHGETPFQPYVKVILCRIAVELFSKKGEVCNVLVLSGQ